jgi:hypothetical protein
MPERLGALLAVVLTSACAGSRAAPPPSPTSEPPPYAPANSTTPAPPATRLADAIRYRPSAVRYVVHRQLHIEQALAGDQTQSQNIGARIFVVVAITGPADSVGYPASFAVDSIVADSGAPAPIADNMSKVRKLVFIGRVAPRGEFVNAVPSDSALAQGAVQLLGSFRDFLPRLPSDGLRLGVTWTDTVETTLKGSGSEVSRRTITEATAAEWLDHMGARSLRILTSQTFRVAGSGKNMGQPFEMAGAGTGTSVAYVAADGRYLGGDAQDSTTLTVRLTVQGVAVPVTQLTRTTVAVLP